ncbi:MAG: hypothetical protein R2856_29700 [Caldilineaceae bacterium]
MQPLWQAQRAPGDDVNVPPMPIITGTAAFSLLRAIQVMYCRCAGRIGHEQNVGAEARRM